MLRILAVFISTPLRLRASTFCTGFFPKRFARRLPCASTSRNCSNHQRDILAPQAVAAVETAISGFTQAVSGKADKAALEKQMESLEKTANKWLKPYPNAAWRENVEVLLVALAVAMGIRTFFLQPFKIPTGSMQPTLYGVDSENLHRQSGFQKSRPVDPGQANGLQGISYLQVAAERTVHCEGSRSADSSSDLQHLSDEFTFAGKTYSHLVSAGLWFTTANHPGTLEAIWNCAPNSSAASFIAKARTS